MRHVHYSRFIFRSCDLSPCPWIGHSCISGDLGIGETPRGSATYPDLRRDVPSLDRVHYVSCWCEVNKFTREKRWTAERSAASAQSHPA